MTQALQPVAKAGPEPIVEIRQGPALAIDEAAEATVASHAFLRRAWFAPRMGAGALTIVGRRGDGSILAAIPLAPMGPPMLGLRMVPGSYWPFRSLPVAADAAEDELRALLSDASAHAALGQAWRLGPVYDDDPAVGRLAAAASACGWTMLRRSLGTTFLLDLPALRAAGDWPRSSVLRKVGSCERRLGAEGPLHIRFVRGGAWDAAALDALAAIEASSWVGRRTDGSGAKFLRVEQRSYWESVLADPQLARMLSAAILFVGETPVAFSFDLNVGRLQYGIAGSYDERFARWSVGKIVTWRHLEESMARGIELVDWGCGDSGYKRDFGGLAGPEIVDLLFVRSRPLARVLRPRWERGSGGGAEEDSARLLGPRERLILAALMTAAAAASLSE